MDMVISTATEDEIKEGAAAHKLKVLDEHESTEVDAEKAEPPQGTKSPTRDPKDDEPGSSSTSGFPRFTMTLMGKFHSVRIGGVVDEMGTVNYVKTLRGCCKTFPMNKQSQRGRSRFGKSLQEKDE